MILPVLLGCRALEKMWHVSILCLKCAHLDNTNWTRQEMLVTFSVLSQSLLNAPPTTPNCGQHNHAPFEKISGPSILNMLVVNYLLVSCLSCWDYGFWVTNLQLSYEVSATAAVHVNVLPHSSSNIGSVTYLECFSKLLLDKCRMWVGWHWLQLWSCVWAVQW